MNPIVRICLSIVLFLSLTSVTSAASLKTATVTRVHNDVRLLPPDRAAETAKPGDVVSGSTGIATGDQSRAELKFPDQTLTRLGSNSIFRLESNSRTVELEEGVILLQVPKQLGGARVRTAAVTAAVTGTTVLVEYTPKGFIKLIVIEGEVDLYFNNKPAHFITLKAGDMIIMKPDATKFPQPVKVDLARLAKTSKLMDDNEFGPLGNQKQLQDAFLDQNRLKKSGELTASAFLIEGRGTLVSLTQEARIQIARNATLAKRPDPSSDSGSDEDTPPSPPAIPPEIPRIAGTTRIDESTDVSTNPSIAADNDPFGRLTSQGAIYNPLTDGPIQPLLGGAPENAFTRQLYRSSGRWSVFQFDQLEITSTPSINSSSGPRNLLLAAQNDVNFSYDPYEEASAPGQFTIGADLDSLAIISQNGSIYMGYDSGISGSARLVILDAYGLNSNVTLVGPGANGEWSPYDGSRSIQLLEGRAVIQAGRDVLFDGARVVATSLDVNAGRDANLNNAGVGALNKVNIKAKRNVNIINNTVISVADGEGLWALSQIGEAELNVLAQNGDVQIDNASLDATRISLESRGGSINLINSSIYADVIKARTLSPNGTITINGSYLDASNLIRLYATGSNGSIRFTGDSSLYAPRVDLAAKTVTVDPGVFVDVNGNVRVFTNNAQFSNAGATGQGTFGNSETGPATVTTKGFKSRPRY